MTEEQDKNIPSDELITALREEYEKKLKDREAELRQEFEAKQKEQEDFLISHLDHYLIPADELAIFIDTHNSDHVMLLLVNNGYSRVPVITKDKKYVGTISIADIMSYQVKHQLTEWELNQMDIGQMVNTKIKTIRKEADLTGIMHLLVDYPFLPVLDDDQQFLGIITRRSILKAVNSLLHDFTNHYTITPKDDEE